jgi:hypothetical protein
MVKYNVSAKIDRELRDGRSDNKNWERPEMAT